MIYKINELKDNMCGIYKINFKNNKCYIGKSKNIRRRMWEHNNHNKAKTLCDLKIKKYGKIFEVEILELLNKDDELLNKRERYWIDYYKSNIYEFGYNITNGGIPIGEEWGNSCLSNEQVLDIRKRRYNSERKCDVYKDYKNIISFGGFEKVWLGVSYKEIGSEYIIPTNSNTRQFYSSKANQGENNNKHKLTKDDVIKIRERFKNGESPSIILKDYSFVKLNTISRVCNYETWKNI